MFADYAMMFLGTNYLWGDCSALTYIAAKLSGLTLPRDSLPQSLTGFTVNLADAVAGDQLFFSSDIRKLTVTHTGIYSGNGDFIHSSGGNGVIISNIYTGKYYKQRFMFAKRRF
jgi:cell wall-associated NlpC family hydrolase